jgi:hypothetical protein
VYSEPDKDEIKGSAFEIIGKVNGNFLVYKNYRDDHTITAYNSQMKIVDKANLNFYLIEC